MRRLILASLLAVAGCEKAAPPPSPLAPIAGGAASQPATPTPAASPVAGWTTDGGDYLLLGRQAPVFSGKLLTGDTFSIDKLRGRWTIVEFRDEDNVDAEEDKFAAALNSAVEQDPDLDLLRVLAPPAVKPQTGRSRPLTDTATTIPDQGRSIIAAFGVNDMPCYLLIGPDLTIEAVRGRLANSPENGIKDVIRGVAEIRKQIANPT